VDLIVECYLDEITAQKTQFSGRKFTFTLKFVHSV